MPTIISKCINYKRCEELVEGDDFAPRFHSEECRKDYFMEYGEDISKPHLKSKVIPTKVEA